MKQLAKILAGRDFVEPRQVHLAEHVVRNQNPAQRRLLAFDFAAHLGTDAGKVESHDAELHHLAVAGAREQDLASIVRAGELRLQHPHVDRAVVKSLDGHRHMAVVRQQHPIVARKILRINLLELAQQLGPLVKQADQRVEIHCQGAGVAHGGFIRLRQRQAHALA